MPLIFLSMGVDRFDRHGVVARNFQTVTQLCYMNSFVEDFSLENCFWNSVVVDNHSFVLMWVRNRFFKSSKFRIMSSSLPSLNSNNDGTTSSFNLHLCNGFFPFSDNFTLSLFSPLICEQIPAYLLESAMTKVKIYYRDTGPFPYYSIKCTSDF